jgi:3-hydroxyisobutyrate dehydrogenase-like beta-hydroxyacid dehydrogenase
MEAPDLLPAGPSASTVGVVGIGRMGRPIAKALSAAYSVGVFDSNGERERDSPDLAWAPSLQQLAHASDVLITVVPGPSELRAVMADALPRVRPGTLWIDLTSGDPAVTRELATRAVAVDVEVVTAPMGGSISEAERCALTFFVSGSERAVDRALPILRELSEDGGVRRAGQRAEDGQIVKLLANGLWFANAVAASEAMLIGQGLGLSPAAVQRLLRDSAGGSRYLDVHAERLLDGDYLTTFGIDRVVEELDTLSAMKDEGRVVTPILDASRTLHRAALNRFGPELGELLAVKLLEDESGRQLRR